MFLQLKNWVNSACITRRVNFMTQIRFVCKWSTSPFASVPPVFIRSALPSQTSGSSVQQVITFSSPPLSRCSDQPPPNHNNLYLLITRASALTALCQLFGKIATDWSNYLVRAALVWGCQCHADSALQLTDWLYAVGATWRFTSNGQQIELINEQRWMRVHQRVSFAR